ncbi:unnamed protein product [Rhodiola kirilowii]
MASQSRVGRMKRPRSDEESTDNPINGGGGRDDVGNEIIATDAFTHDLMDIVCSHLPMLSAARMSVVSPRFKDLWKHSKNMVFDKSMVGGKGQEEVMRIVQSAMNQHQGSKINKFSLYIIHTSIGQFLDDCTKKALAKDVEEIELDHSRSPYRRSLDISVFTETSVRSLKLVKISLYLFGMHNWHSDSMVNLRDLRLRCCNLSMFFGKMICFFRCLEFLEIVNCKNLHRLWINEPGHRNFRTLKIGACLDLEEVQVNLPNLKTFYYQGNIRMISVQSSLERVFVSYKRKGRIVAENLMTKPMVHSAKSLKVLTINSVFLEVMYPEFNKGDLAANESLFPNLNELHIYMENYSYRTVGYLRYLLKRCPCLETLHIDGDKGLIKTKIAPSADTQHFNHLKVIKIKGYMASRIEQDFLQYLVARSPALQTLALVYSKGLVLHNLPSPFIDDHLRHFAISPAVKISHYDHDNDNSCIFPSQTKSWYLP